MKNKFTRVSAVFVIATFLMTGVYQDDEFAEYSSFVKYRPDVQFYFKSPLGMQHMPKDYPPKLIAEEAKYDDFIHGKHWSKRFGGLAMLLQSLALVAVC